MRPAEDPVAAGELPDEGIAFGRYRLLKRLSYGGMGEIFLAKHDGIGGFSKLLVIKRLLQHYRGDADVVTMFFDEAKLQALMNDRHIVQIWDMGKVDDQYFIAMEYVEGTSWRRLLERMRETGHELHPAHAVELGVQACRGLSYAHGLVDAQGRPLALVHRDVNPQNVLITWGGECKIIDFGIAKSEMSGVHTETGTIKGKFAYMSPEQARAEPLDRRSDIFSMGICLYEMLAGHNPFHRKNVVLSLEAICEQAPAPLEQVRPDAAALSPVIERCLAKSADERFADCAELEEALVSLYVDGFFGDPPEPLSELVQRLFRDDIEEQSTFLRRHGFSSVTTQKGSSSDPGSHSPFGVGADATKRTAVLRSDRSRSRSLEGPLGSGRARTTSGRAPAKPSGESPDTHPTATLALASLPPRSHETGSGARGGLSVSEEPPPVVDFAEDTELPSEDPPARSRAARLALFLAVGVLALLGAALITLAAAERQTLDTLLATLTGEERSAPAPVPTPALLEEEPEHLVPPTEQDAGGAAALLEDDAAALAYDAGTVAPDAGVVDRSGPPVAAEPSLAERAEDEQPSAREENRRARRRTSRSPSREASAPSDRAEREPKAQKVSAEPAEPELAGVLTVNAGGPYAVSGAGVRATNLAKISLPQNEARTLTISGGPVRVKLRVLASSRGAEVRVDTDPWTIVVANNLGKGRTPQAIVIPAGQSTQLSLKNPAAGDMKVTLGFSSKSAR